MRKAMQYRLNPTNDHPRFFQRAEKDLARVQRKLSRCEKDTPLWRQALRAVLPAHQRIANCRRDFAHRVSRLLVDTYQLLVSAKLDMKRLQVDRDLNAWRNILARGLASLGHMALRGPGDYPWKQS
jgi:transposase